MIATILQSEDGAAEVAAPDAASVLLDRLIGPGTPWGSYFETHPAARVVGLVAFSIFVALLVDRLLMTWARRLTAKTNTNIDDHVLRVLHRPIFLSALSLGLWLSLRSFADTGTWTETAARVLGTLVLVVWLGALLRVASLLIDASSRLPRFRLLQPETVPLFDNLMKVALWAVGAWVVITMWGIDPTGWLASAGIAGIALGFAAKDTLANLFAGVFIFADSPYKVGDFVNLVDGDRGQVTEIGIRSTRLLTRDDVEITIPNSVIANAKIINESGGPWKKSRIRVKVGIAYGSDIDQVRDILMDIAQTHDSLCEDPAPRVRFRAFGGSSLDFELLGWIEEPVLRGRVLDDLHQSVYHRFNAAGIEIPYSKHDIYIKEVPEGSGLHTAALLSDTTQSST